MELGCVLDTGAEASLIPSDVFHSQLKTQTGNVDQLGASMNIIGVTGTEIPVEGYVRARVKVEGREAVVGFLVVPQKSSGKRHQEFPVLLGCNALRALLQHNVADGEFQLTQDCLNLPSRSVMEASVFTEASDVSIPAKAVQSVNCTINPLPFGETRDELELWLVEGGKVEGRASLQVVEGCISEGTSMNILLVNTSDDDVTLPSNCKLASATKLERESAVAVQVEADSIKVDIREMLVMTGGGMDENGRPQELSPEGEYQRNSDEQKHCTDNTNSLPAGVCLDGMEPRDAVKVKQLLLDHLTAFSSDEFDLGHCSLIPHEIRVNSHKPIRMPYRRISPNETEEVRELLQDMLNRRVIRRSASPYASPVVLVRKKSGALRLCIDYRQLNDVTLKDSFPLPRIEESLEAMDGAKYFSSLDLSHGYFQVSMHPDSIPLTAFRVPWGLFEFERMPQGLCNSPSTFQRIMEAIFSDMNLNRLILYLDDILVFSKTFEEHLATLKEVFTRLTNHGLKLKGGKCQFFQKEVGHLGHIVGEEGVRVDPEKVEKIAKWPAPKNSSELSSFLGLASYYRRFVPDFAKIAGPLHALTGKRLPRKSGKKKATPGDAKNEGFIWSKEADEAFQALKEKLSSTPVLAYPRFGEEFVLEVDASLKGLGACLSQADDDGHLHPIAYASRGLRGAERRYPDFSSFKIEFLALKWAVVEKFKGYLMGAKCIVFTDNNPLAHLQTAHLGATEQRWAAQLASFNLEIRYRPGKLNRCADALSRYPGMEESEVTPSIQELTIGTTLPVEVTGSGEELSDSAVTPIPCVYPSYSPPELAKMQQEDETLGLVYTSFEAGGSLEMNWRQMTLKLRLGSKNILRSSGKMEYCIASNAVRNKATRDSCSSLAYCDA